jgi:hypothetical protein
VFNFRISFKRHLSVCFLNKYLSSLLAELVETDQWEYTFVHRDHLVKMR